MKILNEKVILMPDGVEVPLIFLMDNLRKQFNFLRKLWKKLKKKVQGEEEGFIVYFFGHLK